MQNKGQSKSKEPGELPSDTPVKPGNPNNLQIDKTPQKTPAETRKSEDSDPLKVISPDLKGKSNTENTISYSDIDNIAQQRQIKIAKALTLVRYLEARQAVLQRILNEWGTTLKNASTVYEMDICNWQIARHNQWLEIVNNRIRYWNQVYLGEITEEKDLFE